MLPLGLIQKYIAVLKARSGSWVILSGSERRSTPRALPAGS